MRQRRWLELIKDYDLEVHYHPGKANVVADALSRKARCNCLLSKPKTNTLCDEFRRLGLEMVEEGFLANVELRSTLLEQIKEAQKNDKGMTQIREKVKEGKAKCFTIDDEGVIWFGKRLVVPKDFELRRKILDEAHVSLLSIHPGSSKMYQDLKQKFWWTRMKREIARYVAECDV